MKRIIIFLICTLLLVLPLFAQPNLEATGYDWIEYTPAQKQELVKTLYHILKIDGKVENGVIALDGLYYIYYKEIEADAEHENLDVVFSASVMRVLADIITCKGKPSSKLMQKYGFINVKANQQ